MDFENWKLDQINQEHCAGIGRREHKCFSYMTFDRDLDVYNNAFDLILESDIKGVYKNEISSLAVTHISQLRTVNHIFTLHVHL